MQKFPRYFSLCVSIASLLVILSAPAHAARFKDMADRLPSGANAIVIVNRDQILASSIAQKEGWREQHQKQYAAGLTIVPPSADKFLLASHLDLEFLHPIWESAVAEVTYEADIPRLAVKYGGEVDNIEGREVAELPDDTFVVKLGPKMVASLSPANRQSATRWLRYIKALAERKQTEYLTEALHFADDVGTPVIMAIDFDGLISAKDARERLEQLDALKDANIDLDGLSEVLGGLRGVTLGITIKERAYGKLKVDFKEDIPLAPEDAKKLILEILQRRGAMIDEFHDWRAEVNGKQMSIEGPLYQSGMQRIFSVFDTPAALQEARSVQSAQTTEDNEEALTVAASQQYFKNTQQLLDDLRDKKGFKTAGQIGTWYGKYADRIDRLPMANVDPELTSYGGYVSQSLRQAQASMRSISQRKRVRQAEASNEVPTAYLTNSWAGGSRWGRYGRYGGGWGTGWSGEYYTASEKRAIQQRMNTTIAVEERMRGYTEATDIMQQVSDATGDVRRRMTEKYNVNF